MIRDRIRRPGLVAVAIDSAQIVVDVQSGTTYRLDEVAAAVWHAVGGEAGPGPSDGGDALGHLDPSAVGRAIEALAVDGLIVERDEPVAVAANATTAQQPTDVVPPTQGLAGHVIAGRRVAVTGDAPMCNEMERLLSRFPPAPRVEHHYQVEQSTDAVSIVHNDRLACRVRTEAEALAWFNLHLRRLATTGLEPLVGLHAAALSKDGHVVALLGASGAGKSTLAAELVRRGFRYLSDEVAAVDAATLEVTAVPLPVVLERGSWPLFEDQLLAAGHTPPPRVGSWMIDVARLGGPAESDEATGAAELGLVICVAFRPGSPVEVVSLEPPDALLALLANVFELQRGQPLVDALAEIARRVPCSTLEHGNLRAAADAVERELDACRREL